MFNSAYCRCCFTIIGFSVIHLGFLLPVTAFHSLTSVSPNILCHLELFTWPYCHYCRLFRSFLVPSSASYLFSPTSRCHHQPFILSFKLLVAKINFLSSQNIQLWASEVIFCCTTPWKKFRLNYGGYKKKPVKTMAIK